MKFTDAQQEMHRIDFIDECRQKAWGAVCHAEWIGKQLEGLLGTYQKMQAEHDELGKEVKASETALDYHTADNRTKRKELQEKRNKIAESMKALAENARKGEQATGELFHSADTNMQLATFAETWSWKETEEKKEGETV